MLLLTMVLPFIGFSTWQTFKIYEERRAETHLEGLLMARSVAYSIDDYVVSTEELLLSIVHSDAALDGDIERLQRWFSATLPGYPHYSNIIFVDNEGFIRAAGKKGDQPGLINVADTVYYKRSMETTGLAIGDFMFGKISGAPVVHVCYPVFDRNGRRLGFVAAAMHLGRIQDRIMHEGIPDQMIVNVIDQNGLMVARNVDPEAWVGTDVYEVLRVDRLHQNREGSDELHLPDGTTKICSFTATERIPWYVRCGTDETYVQSLVRGDLLGHFSVFLPLLLFACAGWLWIGRDLDALHSHTRTLALSDGLTGLWNTRRLHDDLRRCVATAARSELPMAFMMIDIDHFKAFNDRNGHQAGDDALRIAAQLITREVREGDTCYRYGGEEFCVILPNADTAGARAVAERVRVAFEDAEFMPDDGEPARLTVSIGVAVYPENARTPEDLVRCADKALYRAKDQGRNLVLACALESGAVSS